MLAVLCLLMALQHLGASSLAGQPTSDGTPVFQLLTHFLGLLRYLYATATAQ